MASGLATACEGQGAASPSGAGGLPVALVRVDSTAQEASPPSPPIRQVTRPSPELVGTCCQRLPGVWLEGSCPGGRGRGGKRAKSTSHTAWTSPALTTLAGHWVIGASWAAGDVSEWFCPEGRSLDETRGGVSMSSDMNGGVAERSGLPRGLPGIRLPPDPSLWQLVACRPLLGHQRDSVTALSLCPSCLA